MPASLEAVVVIALLLLPGYIGTVTFRRGGARSEVSDTRFLLQVSFWGALSHFVAFPLTGAYLGRVGDAFTIKSVTVEDALLAMAVLLVLPVVVGGGARFLLNWSLMQGILGRLRMTSRDWMPTAWDDAIGEAQAAWVRVYVRGQSEPIVGMFGKNSRAGLSPNPHDFFLQERYVWKDTGLEPVANSAGVYIAAGEIEFVELFRAN